MIAGHAREPVAQLRKIIQKAEKTASGVPTLPTSKRAYWLLRYHTQKQDDTMTEHLLDQNILKAYIGSILVAIRKEAKLTMPDMQMVLGLNRSPNAW